MGNAEWIVKSNSAAPLFTFAFQLVCLATSHGDTRPAAGNLILFLPISVFAIMEAP